jgi:cystathionine beta-lyase
VVRQLEGNGKRAREFLAKKLPAIGHRSVEASYFLWLDCTELALPSRPQAFFLEQGRVAFNDGAPFGGGSERFARLNFATPQALLDEILERMRRAVDAL